MVFTPLTSKTINAPTLPPSHTFHFAKVTLVQTPGPLEIRYLGQFLDRHLSFTQHMAIVAARALCLLNALKRVSGTAWVADTPTLLRVYQACVRPVMEYSSVVFACASRRTLSTHDVIQNKAIGIMLQSTKSVGLAAASAELTSHTARCSPPC